ncbi:hypothetical protein PIB30_026415 [Stylosanthes scabra]|uniref:SCP domain-containing protein n=1 Tax=Stylosanthes scabra TaxID=79078 RepID=A0ABU6TA14_9FABA|nr:hypothetical protein [Stylosanthes scabra]
MKISFLWLIISCVCILPWCLAQNSPADYLKVHNDARARVGVKPLEWDPGLQSYAHRHLSKYLRNCIPRLSNGCYGESLSSSVDEVGPLKEVTGKQVVEMWVEQKHNYDEETNSCVGGECRNYTQVVWRETTHVGCARVQCYNGAYMVACNYHPPGNYRGERPY